MLSASNETETKAVVQAANSWCKRRMPKKSIINDAMDRLNIYFKAVDEYIEKGGWTGELKDFTSTYLSGDDMMFVEC